MHLVLIDAMSLLFRAYHAVRPLNRARDGLPTNALYGFSQMLIKVVKDLNPDRCVVVSDSPPPNWRHGLYDRYKANRPPPDEELKAQLPYLEPLVAAFGLPLVRQAGLEADDLIASAVAQALEQGTGKEEKGEAGSRITIVTSDKDLLQLVRDGAVEVRLFDSLKDKFLGPAAAVEKFGVPPPRVLQVQALMGDSSDNIPGIAGVGPKTAADLIQQFGDLETLYTRLNEVTRDTLREKLAAGKEAAFLSRQLASLKADVPLDLAAWEVHVHLPQAAAYLRDELEFASLAKRLEQGKEEQGTGKKEQLAGAVVPVVAGGQAGWGPYRAILTTADWQQVLQQIRAAGLVALDTETTSLNPRQARVVGLCLAWGENQAVYVPVKGGEGRNAEATADLFAAKPVGPHGVEGLDVRDDLRAVLADGAIQKVGHNLKYDWEVLEGYLGAGFALNNYDDTLLLAQTTLPSTVTQGGGYGLDNLARQLLGHGMIPYDQVAGKGKTQVTFDHVPLEAATAYAAEDADATWRLWQALRPTEPNRVYATIERPLLPVLVRMEQRGVCVDAPYLRQLSATMGQELAALEGEIQALAGKPFNVQSTQQLAVVLFDELGAGSDKQRKSRSTAVEVLEDLAAGAGPAAEITKRMLQYRQSQKLRSTYTEALLNQIEPRTGRVHTHYMQMGAATGRFSSSEPNLQNIPIRTAAGRQVRQAFIPQPGWQMVSADYSQIELRLLAHLSGSVALKKAFTEGLDIHAYTASLVAGVPLESVTKEQRRAAKFINFGLVYGMGARSLAGQIGCSVADAQGWIDAYFARYDGVRDYMEFNKRQVRERGYVETLFGRKVWLPEIHSANAGLRAGAERAAINAPLQGSNADIIKLAMPKVAAALAAQWPNQAALLLQVHDELVLEAAPEAVAWLQAELPQLMGGVVSLSVPLAVEVGVGPNWDAAH
ncbi:MAG: DNA polymerase I [Alphaproteobacteria bacterium]|nr:DNA polymerase I [Alphaproteobacteria bacterium]